MHTVSGHSALIACKCLRCTHFAWLNASFCELWAERRTAYAVKPECNQGSEICSLLLCIGIISVNLWLKLSFSHVKQFVQVKTCYAHGASRGSNTRCHDKKGCRWAGTCWVHFTGAWLIRPVSGVQGQRCGGQPGPRWQQAHCGSPLHANSSIQPLFPKVYFYRGIFMPNCP